MSKWSKFLDVLCFLVGSVITAYFLFSLSADGSGTEISGRWHGGWSDDERIGIAVGVALIVLGFLRKHWRKNERKDK